MPLQIRRGNTAQRLTIIPLPGELIYDTSTGQLFVGDGVTPGGVGGGGGGGGLSTEEVQDTAATMFLSGVHNGISFSYDDAQNRINASVSFTGSFVGSVLATNATLLVDGNNALIVGPISTTQNVNINQIESSTIPRRIRFNKARGTSGSPTPVINGDSLSSIQSLAYDGTGYKVSASINVSINGAVSTSVLPSKISFFNQNLLGELKNPLEITSDSVNGFPALLLNSNRGTVETPSKVEPGDRVHQLLFQSWDGAKFLGHASINVEVGTGSTSVDNIPTLINVDILHSSGIFIRPLQVDSNGTVNFFKNIAAGSVARFFQNHDTADAANIEFFRSRGAGLSPTSIVANDDIIDFAFAAHYNGTYRTSVGLEVKATSFVGNRVVSKINLAMDNGIGFAERFVLESEGIIDFKQSVLVAGSNPGEVDTSSPVSYMRVKLNGAEYALPLFAINP